MGVSCIHEEKGGVFSGFQLRLYESAEMNNRFANALLDSMFMVFRPDIRFSFTRHGVVIAAREAGRL